MSNFLQFILVITIIIICTKAGGYLSIKLKQPAVVGELLAGIALGPTLLDIMHWSILTDHHLPEFVNHLGEFGVILLMLLAGMHLHIDDLIESSKNQKDSTFQITNFYNSENNAKIIRTAMIPKTPVLTIDSNLPSTQ